MNLLLVCETSIIVEIFSLICRKLNLDIIVETSLETKNKNYDFIIIDQNFIDDKFNSFKQYCKKLGAISSEELPFDKSRDFLIPRPFLPKKLEYILKEQIEFIKDEEKKEKTIYNNRLIGDEYLEDNEVTIPVVDYMESLVDDVYNDINDENDESVISIASINDGGVLDKSELNKLNDILKDRDEDFDIQQNDWKNISDIIDDALDEVKDYEFNFQEDDNSAFELILNNHKMNELKPLLSKLNQNIIDSLANGEEIDIKLKLKKD